MTQFPLERFKGLDTPFYYYDMDLLKATLRAVCDATSGDGRFKVHYAVKANANYEILKAIAEAGFGADCVSGGEIQLALAAGFKAEDIMFAGVGKTDVEIEMGLNAGIGMFNVESEPELEVIMQISERLGKVATVALRVNPDIDAHTHHYITTGLDENKFGIDHRLLAPIVNRAVESPWIDLAGLHFHIGSQITIGEPFVLLCYRVNSMVKEYAKRGINFRSINVGGGLGVDYENPDANPIPDFGEYFDLFKNYLKLSQNQTIHFELGRSIVAECGSLISRVLYVKEGVNKKFAIIDAGFNDLIRPAFYQAQHLIQNLSSYGPTREYEIVGPICETSDSFGCNIPIAEARRGDLLAIRSAGAYGQTMSMTYNGRPLAGAYYSDSAN
ncbi:MAG: diaminopimelate decarboxylase [Muribaculaceae bacterium]|nr:diaminopimelate decarboxylase [Muribaculaceae bacterium]